MCILEQAKTFKPEKSIDLSFTISPRSLSFTGNKMVLVDEYAHKLYFLDNSGKVINSIGSKGKAPDEFLYPTCICTDDEGFIWVTDRWNHRVKRLSVDGKTVMTVGKYGTEQDNFSEPTGIQYYKSHIYVADRNNHRVKIFDKQGSFIRCFGMKGPEKKYFESTEFKNGYIFQSWFIMATKFSTPDTFFHKEGNVIGNMEYPIGLSVSPAGEIIVVDSASDRLKWFSADENLLRTVEPENLSIPFEFISDIAFLSDDTYVMATELNDIAVVLDKNSDILYLLSYPGGRLNYLYCGIDAVWVLDSWNRQLHKFRLK